MLRQQADHGDSRPNRSLADFVAPEETGLLDHVGAFAISVHGAEEVATAFERDGDDYNSIMVKALADRLAEAGAEWLHEQTRRAWYAPDEQLSDEELAVSASRGSGPRSGTPPARITPRSHVSSRCSTAGRVGMELTESCAMTPAASVSGIYLGHPSARYFSVGRIGRDQVEDYAERKGEPLAEVERWLRPNLAYDPD